MTSKWLCDLPLTICKLPILHQPVCVRAGDVWKELVRDVDLPTPRSRHTDSHLSSVLRSRATHHLCWSSKGKSEGNYYMVFGRRFSWPLYPFEGCWHSSWYSSSLDRTPRYYRPWCVTLVLISDRVIGVPRPEGWPVLWYTLPVSPWRTEGTSRDPCRGLYWDDSSPVYSSKYVDLYRVYPKIERTLYNKTIGTIFPVRPQGPGFKYLAFVALTISELFFVSKEIVGFFVGLSGFFPFVVWIEAGPCSHVQTLESLNSPAPLT